MPVRCQCFPINDPRVQHLMNQNGLGSCPDDFQNKKTDIDMCKTLNTTQDNTNRRDDYCTDDLRHKKPDIDMCKIWKRTQDKASKHDDYDCHYKGERRQNLINKLKMFLDDIDDRPVMKRKSKGKDDGSVKGQSGFGPMIKYPGYVDYDHPYFSEPYNKMPDLAFTSGYHTGINPCSPATVTVPPKSKRDQRGQNESCDWPEGNNSSSWDSCHCAKLRKERNVEGPASSCCQPKVNQRNWHQGTDMCNQHVPGNPATTTHTHTGPTNYYCYPLPTN